MRSTQSMLTLAASLLIVLMFVLGINLITGTTLTARLSTTPRAQQDDGMIAPARGEQPNQKEQWDEDEDTSDQEDEDEMDDEDDEGDDEQNGDEGDDEDSDVDVWGEFESEVAEQEEDEMDEDDEGDDEHDDDEGDDEDSDVDIWSEFETEVAELKMERAGVETNIGRLEVIARLADIAKDELATASYAIMHIGEFMEPDEAIEMLEALNQASDVSRDIKNLVRMKLAEVYAWQGHTSDAKAILESMIRSK